MLKELKEYNPELLDKERILGISKSDMLDDELINEMKEELPDLPHVFFSSITQMGLTQLKDMIWRAINS